MESKLLFVLASVILFSGCITSGPFCQYPYIEYQKGSCCLDANGNGICDGDETTVTTLPVAPSGCEANYYEYAAGQCCLDLNYNMVCDIDETTTQASVITTLGAATTTLAGLCTDTDGGENTHVKGVTTGYGVIVPADAGQPDVYAYISREDTCSSNWTVDEYYCNDRVIRVIHIDCNIIPGEMCQDGRCVTQTT